MTEEQRSAIFYVFRGAGATYRDAWGGVKRVAEILAPEVKAETETQRLISRFLDGIEMSEPMFWVRLCGSSLYEGPVHHKSAEGKVLRDEKPDEWHPLYLAEPTVTMAKQRAMQMLWDDQAPEEKAHYLRVVGRPCPVSAPQPKEK